MSSVVVSFPTRSSRRVGSGSETLQNAYASCGGRQENSATMKMRAAFVYRSFVINWKDRARRAQWEKVAQAIAARRSLINIQVHKYYLDAELVQAASRIIRSPLAIASGRRLKRSMTSLPASPISSLV